MLTIPHSINTEAQSWKFNLLHIYRNSYTVCHKGEIVNTGIRSEELNSENIYLKK